MPSKLLTRNISRLYLACVPFLAFIIGFGLGHSPFKIYLPVWVIHSILMILLISTLSADVIKGSDIDKKQQVLVALPLILPWMFFTLFAGMGRPPMTMAGWVASAAEQQARFIILIIGGIVAGLGFGLLKLRLNKAGETIYSTMGQTAIQIAIPLFVLNMSFWGAFLTEAFKAFTAAPQVKKPDWYVSLSELFYYIAVVEVSLIYLATAAFAVSLKAAGLFRPAACRVYVAFSCFGAIVNLLPPSLGDPFTTASYLVAIPAVPFIMPYLIGINLLRAGKG